VKVAAIMNQLVVTYACNHTLII